MFHQRLSRHRGKVPARLTHRNHDTPVTGIDSSLGSRQYCSHDFQEQLASYGMLASMSRKGNCWDNATSESFFNRLKNERVHGANYETRDQARADIFEYVEIF